METIFKLSSKKDLNTRYNYAYPYCNQIYRQLALQEMKIGDEFTKLFKKEVYPKDYYLLKPNQIANKFWVIVEGKAVLFRNCDGTEITSHFFVDNDIMAVCPSYYLQMRTEYGIYLKERTVVYEAKWADLHRLQPKYVALYDLELKLLNLFLLETMDHSFCLNTMTNEQHIAHVQKHKPLLFNSFFLWQIYTYFGMKYSSFRRARKKMIKQWTKD
jgi:hypothetical protein